MFDQKDLQNLTTLPLGCLSITGEQATEFLQGQISCNVEHATGYQMLLGVRLNLQGRVLANFRLLPYESGYLLITAKDNVAHLKQSLDKYAIFSKVELIDRSEDITVAGINCAKINDNTPPAITQGYTNYTVYEEGIYYYKLFDDYHYEIIHDAKRNDKPSITLHNQSNNTQYANWTDARIRSLLPEITANMSEMWTAHQLNLVDLGFIDFDKGCYLGQEIVARMEYRASIKEGLYLLDYPDKSNIPQSGEKLLTGNNKAVGSLVELCTHPESSSALGLAALKHNYADTDLFIGEQAITIISQY